MPATIKAAETTELLLQMRRAPPGTPQHELYRDWRTRICRGMGWSCKDFEERLGRAELALRARGRA